MQQEHEAPPSGGESVSDDALLMATLSVSQDTAAIMANLGGDLKNVELAVQEIEQASVDNLTTERLANIKLLAILSLRVISLAMIGPDPVELEDMPIPFMDGTAGDLPQE